MIKLWLDGGVWIFVPCRRYQRHTSLHTSQQEEFQELKAKVKASGKRKDVTVPWSNIASYIVHHYLTLWLVNPLFSRKVCLEGLILPFVAGCGSPSQIYPWVTITPGAGRSWVSEAFLLYERGGQFLDQEQYAAMKEEYDRLGISPLDHPTSSCCFTKPNRLPPYCCDGWGSVWRDTPEFGRSSPRTYVGTQGQHRRNTSPTYRTRAVSTSIPAVEWNKNITNVGIKMTR